MTTFFFFFFSFFFHSNFTKWTWKCNPDIENRCLVLFPNHSFNLFNGRKRKVDWSFPFQTETFNRLWKTLLKCAFSRKEKSLFSSKNIFSYNNVVWMGRCEGLFFNHHVSSLTCVSKLDKRTDSDFCTRKVRRDMKTCG